MSLLHTPKDRVGCPDSVSYALSPSHGLKESVPFHRALGKYGTMRTAGQWRLLVYTGVTAKPTGQIQPANLQYILTQSARTSQSPVPSPKPRSLVKSKLR